MQTQPQTGPQILQAWADQKPTALLVLADGTVLEGLGLARTRPEEAPKRYAHWLDEVRDPFKEGRYESLAQLASILRMRNPRLTQDVAEFVAGAWSRPAGAGTEVILHFDPRHRLVNPILYRREEAEACWARLEVPMLLVMGELSDHRARHTGYVTDQQLHALFRKLRLVTVPGTGHMMHHEDPATVARHIVEFERACAASAP